MRLLVDANLSHDVAELAREAGHDALHARDVGLRHASDAEILDAAVAQDRVIVSEDTDLVPCWHLARSQLESGADATHAVTVLSTWSST